MPGIRKSIVPLFLSLICCLINGSTIVPGQDKHEVFFRFVQSVNDILGGKDAAHTQDIIAQRARLIYGTRFESLKSVVAGEIKGLALADTSYHGVMIEAQTNQSEDAGFLVLKTVKSDPTQVRFHTIMFMKDSTGSYRINCWHAGACSR